MTVTDEELDEWNKLATAKRGYPMFSSSLSQEAAAFLMLGWEAVPRLVAEVRALRAALAGRESVK